MSTETPRPLSRAALILNAGVFVFPVALGSLFAAAIKAVNPSGTDVTHELAYLRPILVLGMVLVAVFVLAAVAIDVVLSRRKDPSAGSLWLILVVQLVAMAVFLVARLWEGAVTGG